MTAYCSEINISARVFQRETSSKSLRSVRTEGVERTEIICASGEQSVLDSFTKSSVRCGFLRRVADQDQRLHLVIPGGHSVKSCLGGGWLLEPEGKNDCHYWVPQAPTLRLVTSNGHIAKEIIDNKMAFQISAASARLELDIPADYCLDVVAWEIPSQETEIISALCALTTLETQPVFLWGSHTRYQRPADIYSHLIFGHVYENRYLWPFHRKNCSENDAHALYVTFSGLHRATGKKLYELLKNQLLISVLARQSADGGWRHGEWSDDMEAHLRLNGSAIHLLLNSLEERDDQTVREAVERAVSFVSRHKDETKIGTWLLHDSLEMSVDGMNKSPFKWRPSSVLGKCPSNMLVLNTHLDSLVLLERYRRITGDRRYVELVESAKCAARTILNLRPLECFYRLAFSLIRLNLLPTQIQMKLPLPLRVIKRLVRKWLTPNFFKVTARFPRLVMPGGYIERAVALGGMADSYHSINLMDLVRFARCCPDENIDTVINDAVAFVEINEVLTHWGEKKEKQYAIGFWAEALYHMYLLAPDSEKLSKLAEAIFKLEELGMGLPPSMLGANQEAVPPRSQIGCSSAADGKIRVANLSRENHAEFLVVNPTMIPRRLSWESPVPCQVRWKSHSGEAIKRENDMEIPARSWIVGYQQLNPITIIPNVPHRNK